MTERVSVLLPVPLAGPLDYRVPPGVSVTAGDVVMVPLHGRTLHAVVWDSAPDPALSPARLKPLTAVAGLPRLATALRRFIDWVAAYTLSAPGDVLAMAIRSPLLAAPPPQLSTGWLPGDTPPESALTPARRRLLDVLEDGRPRALADLIREAGVGQGVARAMADRGWLRPVTRPRLRRRWWPASALKPFR
jgi:primosomal protein N' (replication factor Y)